MRNFDSLLTFRFSLFEFLLFVSKTTNRNSIIYLYIYICSNDLKMDIKNTGPFPFVTFDDSLMISFALLVFV